MLALALLAVHAAGQSTGDTNWRSAVTRAARSVPNARILVLDIAGNRVLAGHHLAESARTLAAPGSSLKPLILYQLLSTSRWSADHRIACNRDLVIADHKMACSHLPSPPFNAREALAWSCNTYFAQLARSLTPGELGKLLRPTGLLGTTGLAAKSGVMEASAEFREPGDAGKMQLAVLGVEGIRITPFELAAAYRWLALTTAAHPDSVAAQQVMAGLADSANFGIASGASAGGVSIAGKTGTAEGITSAQTHGWFAGLFPAENPHTVIVVYLPSGHGAVAARVTGEMLSHVRGVRPQ